MVRRTQNRRSRSRSRSRTRPRRSRSRSRSRSRPRGFRRTRSPTRNRADIDFFGDDALMAHYLHRELSARNPTLFDSELVGSVMDYAVGTGVTVLDEDDKSQIQTQIEESLKVIADKTLASIVSDEKECVEVLGNYDIQLETEVVDGYITVAVFMFNQRLTFNEILSNSMDRGRSALLWGDIYKCVKTFIKRLNEQFSHYSHDFNWVNDEGEEATTTVEFSETGNFKGIQFSIVERY